MSLRSLAELTLYQFRALYREKVAFFFNLIFPVLMVGIFGSVFNKSVGMVFFHYLMPGQVAVALLSAGMVTVAVNIAAQRQTGILRHMFSTPLSIGAWTFSRVIANFVMAIVQLIVLFIFAGLVFDVSAPHNVGGTLVVLTLSMLVSVGIGLFIGMLVKGESTAVSATMPPFMVLLFLGNSMMPLENPPPFIEAIRPFVPAYHMTEALRAVMMRGDGLSSITGELSALILFGAAFFGIALWRMRRQFVVQS